MLKKLHIWIERCFSIPDQQDPKTALELAKGVLMFEVMRADHSVSDEELALFRPLLEQELQLSDTDFEAFFADIQVQAEDAVDFVQFTRLINQYCDHEQKRSLLDALWRLAYADKYLDGHEEQYIRHIADLLYLPHSQFIQSKLAAQAG